MGESIRLIVVDFPTAAKDFIRTLCYRWQVQTYRGAWQHYIRGKQFANHRHTTLKVDVHIDYVAFTDSLIGSSALVTLNIFIPIYCSHDFVLA